MPKITITLLSTLMMLFGAASVASASEKERDEQRNRPNMTQESAEYCREDGKSCGYRYKRDRYHEAREYRHDDDDDGYRNRTRRHHSDD